MTVALAASIVECGQVDAAHAAATYADRYEPWRGYGGAARRVLCALKDGADYRGTGRAGSFPTAPSATVAPCGLRRWAWPIARPRTKPFIGLSKTPCSARTCIPTPLTAPSSRPGPSHWQPARSALPNWPRSDLSASSTEPARTTVMQAKLEAVVSGLQHDDSDALVIARVGNGIEASAAVAAALWAFLRYGQTPEACIIRAVGFGGDTDTIGAMAGALAGALHGTAWVPARWYRQRSGTRRNRRAGPATCQNRDPRAEEKRCDAIKCRISTYPAHSVCRFCPAAHGVCRIPLW